MAFPSVISSFTNPAATDKLNSPSHSAIETAQNNELVQVENVIGVEGASSVVGSLQYLLKSPASDGGGHVQVANKGGTGQTSYAKGDLLVASSGSVLSKLTVGSNDQILTADSAQSAGVKWATNSGTTPAWVDEGSLTWTASTSDQTLTLANSGKDMYMIVINLTRYTNGLPFDLRPNNVTSNDYNYTYLTSTGIGNSNPSTSLTLVDTADAENGIVGTVMINGVRTTTTLALHATGNLTAGLGSHTLLRGTVAGAAANLSSLKFLVNGATVTGKVHVYSLNL